MASSLSSRLIALACAALMMLLLLGSAQVSAQAVELTADSFDVTVSSKNSFVMFKARFGNHFAWEGEGAKQ